MDGLSIRFVFDQKGKTKKDSKYKAMVHVEVFDKVSRKKTYIRTDVKILKSQYSTNAGFSIINHPNAAVLKAKAYKVYNAVEAFVFSDKCETFKDIQNWDKKEVNNESMLVFIEEEARKENLGKSSLSNFNSFLRRLKDFDQIEKFSDITYANIEDFDNYIKKFGESQPVVYRKHKYLEHYINKAIRRGYIERNPYLDFEVKKGKHKPPVYLTEEEVQKVIDYTPVFEIEKMQRIKDLFLFQCFTGLSYTDLKAFSKESIVNSEDGFKEIHDYRIKTKQKYASLLLPIAEEIAEKYDYKLPVISNQKYNTYLKTLMERVCIPKNVTSHSGRHTYATYLINRGISIQSISRALGHSSIRMTENYAKLFDKTGIDEMKSKLIAPKEDEEKKDDKKTD